MVKMAARPPSSYPSEVLENRLPPRCASRFEFVAVLAAGAFGTVVRAQDRSLGRPVAIKLLHDRWSSDPDVVARFAREARATAALRHPHIVQVIDADVEDGVPWIAYEHLDGPSLAERIAGGPIPWPEVAMLVSQIAEALAHAHEAGVLHRDVKPANILMADPRSCKLADFGLSSWTEDTRALTRTGCIIGTPAYLAPELGSGGVPSVATDIYGLGVTLVELGTGQRPDRGEPLLAGLPATIAVAAAGALAPDLRERFASARDVAAALEPMRLAGRGTGRKRITSLSSPVSLPATPQRRPGAVLAALLVGASAWIFWPESGQRGKSRAAITAPSSPVSAVTMEEVEPGLFSEAEATLRGAKTVFQEGTHLYEQYFSVGGSATLARSLSAIGAQRDETRKLATELGELEERIGARPPVGAAAQILWARVTIARFRSMALLDRTGNMLESLSSAGALGLAMSVGSGTHFVHHPTELAALTRSVERALAAFETAAGEPAGAPAELADLVEEMWLLSRASGFSQWKRSDAVRVEMVNAGLRKRITALPGPAGQLLANVVGQLWESGQPRAKVRLRPVVVAEIAGQMTGIGALMPRTAPRFGAVVERLRLFAEGTVPPPAGASASPRQR